MSAEQCEVRFDRAAFSIESIKKALYRLADRIDAEIRIDEADVVCVVRARPPTETKNLDRLVTLLRREVLDQDLRASIRKETEGIRNIVLAYAFSKTGLVQSE